MILEELIRPENIKNESRNEVDKILDSIFESVQKAIRENEKKITLEKVDETLNALFDVINKVSLEGKNVKIPNFSEIL